MTVPHEVSPRLGDLSPLEQRLVDSARSGDPLLADALDLDDLAEKDGPDRVVRADLIRDLLLGRYGELDPRGVRAAWVRVVGELDLSHVRGVVGLDLRFCVVDEPLNLYAAQLPLFRLSDCHAPGLFADVVRVESDVILNRLQVVCANSRGAVHLNGASIGGGLVLTGARLINDGGPALVANGVVVGGQILADEEFHAVGTDSTGTVQLVGGSAATLVIRAATLENSIGPALHGSDLRIAGFASLDAGCRAIGAGDNGVVYLDGASFGSLVLREVHLESTSGPALMADHVRISRSCEISESDFTASSARGAIRLINSEVGGQLAVRSSRIKNTAGPALGADNMSVGSQLWLEDGCEVAGEGEIGVIRLLGSSIASSVIIDVKPIVNPSGPVVVLDGARIGGDLGCHQLVAEGAGSDGVVRLSGARITGSVYLSGARLTNVSGPTLVAEAAHIGHDLGLGGGFQITGTEARTSVTLRGTVVEGAVVLPPEVLCSSRATWGPPWPCLARAPFIELDDFTYRSYEAANWRQWLHLIRCHALYHPTAYQHFALVEARAGHNAHARQILITQQEDRRRFDRESIGGPIARFRQWIWGLLAGYGYQSRRTWAALALFLVVAGGLGWCAGQVETAPGRHAAERTVASGSPVGTPCSGLELVGVGLDRGLPLPSPGIRSKCDLDTTTSPGRWFTIAIWLVQAAVWALVTLAVASYTGLVRKMPA